MYKKFVKYTLIFLIVLLLLLIILTWYVDPLFQYHKPFIHINMQGYNSELYQNPGVIKNFDYDSLITGSSMVENFRTSWFENEIPSEKIIKVPYSGGYSKNYDKVFSLAFKTHEIKTIYYGLDIFSIFEKDPNQVRHDLPEYLYDDNIFNDVQYIFNKDVFYKYTIKNLIDEDIDNDLAYNWNKQFKYGLSEIKKTYTRPKVISVESDVNTFMKNYDQNLENITRHIEAHPNTIFKIFIPPYSVLSWDSAVRGKNVNARIAITKRVVEDLLKYNNVELYYFQNCEEIITNFDYYKDINHYSEDINYYMFECMCKTQENKITKENYLYEIKKMENIVNNYDFDVLF